MNFDTPKKNKTVIPPCPPKHSDGGSGAKRSRGIYMNNPQSRLIAVFTLISVIFLTRSASAAGLVPDACTGDATGCNLDQIFVLIATVGNYILGISGALALLMFVIGGFFMILSGYGGKGWNDKGKKMLTSAVVGLIIIFGSYLIVDFVLVALTKKGVSQTTNELTTPTAVQVTSTICSSDGKTITQPCPTGYKCDIPSKKCITCTANTLPCVQSTDCCSNICMCPFATDDLSTCQGLSTCQ